jgi:hypothetical protein
MMPDPEGFMPGQGPGDIDIILGTTVQNPFKDKILKIMSSSTEFPELNGKLLQPGEVLHINLFVPAGYREFIKSTTFKGQPYLYVGLQDKDVVDPYIYKPNL